MLMNNWSSSIDSLLDKIRLNCIQLTNRHIKNHLYYKGASAYFELPTIILSVFSGSFSVGKRPIHKPRKHISYNSFYINGYNHFNKYKIIYEDYREFQSRARISYIV